MVIVHGFLLVCGLTLVARLIQLQIIDRKEYSAAAQAQHYGGVKLPAQRGEIFAVNSKTGDKTILATNTTLDLVYVDPYVTPDPGRVADMLANILVTDDFYKECSQGSDLCPHELIAFQGSPFAEKFDPLSFVKTLDSGALLEPLPAQLPSSGDQPIPDITEVRRLFARDIENRISQKRVTFVPIKYSVTKQEADAVQALNIPGITVNMDNRLIWGNPEALDQGSIASTSRRLASVLNIDPATLQNSLRSRALRYVAIMRKLPPDLTLKINEEKLKSLTQTNQLRAKAPRGEGDKILDPLGGVALLPESWRYYPDDTVASQVVGFMNQNQEAQYGIERTFDTQLRGTEGLISTVSDLQGGQILTSNQTIVDAKNGDSVVLTIDPFIQKKIEQILDDGVKKYNADSGQAIVMDPYTGRILAMANAPLFERNDYASVYDKVPITIPPDKQKNIVVEIYNPDTNEFIVRDYMNQVLTDSGRTALPKDIQQKLSAVQQNYDLKSIARYYLYLGENARIEIFPTGIPDIWLKYKNNIGVGAYLNSTIQQIYEPGSVMKPITMAIALDQGEVTPDTIYDDDKPVKVDQFTINNALHKLYGKVDMSSCLAWSINTCLTSVSGRLGSKLFEHEILQFGFGRVTGVQLDDEITGDIKPWQKWSLAGLATASFGQGISATPLQVITAFSALANGGKLMKPSIIDSVIHADGTVDKVQPTEVNQVITKQTSDTITSMLVYDTKVGWATSGVVKGYSMAAKTGTSQIAGPGGRYESGTGSTVGTYMGFGPVPNPKFILLVKIDRAKNQTVAFGETSAAPLWHDIAQFLFQYYNIPPIGPTK
ncbi:MAG TPA: penicillin-binding protein 2 [Candidatus Peribacteraceae bacterium]|nr:penicillin-binding protein 2 [Candidatus Peribacteraceae bacterium]